MVPKFRRWSRGSESAALHWDILKVVEAQLRVTTEKHQTLLGRMDDVQSAWALLLQCVSARANWLLRGVWPELVRSSAERHNAGFWKCLANSLNLSGNWDVTTKDFASLPLPLADQPSSFLGGLGRLVGHDQNEASPAGRHHRASHSPCGSILVDS